MSDEEYLKIVDKINRGDVIGCRGHPGKCSLIVPTSGETIGHHLEVVPVGKLVEDKNE